MKKTPEVKKKKKLLTRDEQPVLKKRKLMKGTEKVTKKKTAEEPVKKKSKSRALSVGASAISRLDSEGLATIMGSSAEKIQQLLEVGNSDSASNLLQKRMLQALIDLLPHAEANVRATKGQRGVYQINSLITSVREILSDLQAVKDRGALGHQLVERTIRPTFMDIGMQLVFEEETMGKLMREHLDTETYKVLRAEQKNSVRRLAEFIQRKYEEAKLGTVTFLQA